MLDSKIIPSKNGNFELSEDAYVDFKAHNGVNEFYVIASFKSDQVQHLLKGQSAKIVVDDFPELSFSGKVMEINSLKNEPPFVAPDNQSGNYVKMVQRFPVTIKVEIPPADKDKFKSRMSCTVSVATTP